ncbi:MAG: winged helix-turn-helix domain-containing protein [archaeon]|jgi:predicted transcriptional regulator|nr:winged helix-turn-helix domain-containing protein [archaeon]
MLNSESPEQPFRNLNSNGQKMSSEKDRRSKMEMYLDILRAIGSGAEKPTHVMYKANLSWVVMRGFLENLKAQGLVEEALVEGRSSLHLSNRGFELLNQFLLVREYFVNIS